MHGARNNHRGSRVFRDCVVSCGLSDLGFSGSNLTWKRGSLKEQLDRVLVNSTWALAFLDALNVHVPFMGSDHCPLWIKLSNSNIMQRPKPFKLLAAWQEHENFNELVTRKWSRDLEWNKNIS